MPSPQSLAAALLRVVLAVGGLLLVLSSPVRATTAIRPSDEALTLGSDAIVRGRVVALRPYRMDGGTIYTAVTLAVDEVLKGYIPSAWVTLRERGGELDGTEVRVFGAARYVVGESVVVFLSQDDDGWLRTTHMALGKFAIEQEPARTAVAVRRLDEDGLHVLEAAPQSREPVERRTLETFTSQLRSLVRMQPLAPLRAPLAAATLAGPDASAPAPGLSAHVESYRLFNNVRWFEPDRGDPVRYQVDQGGDAKIGASASRNAVEAAFAAWNAVAGASLRLESGGAATPRPDAWCDGVSAIVFNDPFGDVSNPSGCGGILAVGGYCAGTATRTVNGVEFRQVNEGDIIFNDGWSSCGFWNQTNLAEVATHELGHTIGLSHSTDGSATMYSFAHFDGRGARLMADDEAGARFIYPASGGPTPVPTPTAPPPPDVDLDGVPDSADNCPAIANEDQDDLDADGHGDACDNCAAIANPAQDPADTCGALRVQSLSVSIGREGAGDKLRARGRFTGSLGNMSIGAIAGTTLALTVRHPDGTPIAQIAVPAGRWTANRTGTQLLFADRTGALLGGLTRLALTSRNGTVYSFALTARDLALDGARLPELLVTLEAADVQQAGVGNCRVGRRGKSVRCVAKR